MTDARAAAFYAATAENIAKTGRSIVSVFDVEQPFTYTIGNALAGLPELLIFGPDPRTATQILNVVSDRSAAGILLFDGDPVDLGGAVALRAVRARESAKDDYAIQATRYLGTRAFTLFQLLVPDPEGRFPGEPGCAEPWSKAPVLRERSH